MPCHLDFLSDELLRGAEDGGDVEVVSAGVHDSDLLVGVVFCGDGAGVGEAGLFGDGERVELGAQEEARARAVGEDGHDAVGGGAVGIFADVLGDGEAEFAERGGEIGGGPLFVVGELGVLVEGFVGVDEAGELLLDCSGGLLGVRCGCGED